MIPERRREVAPRISVLLGPYLLGQRVEVRAGHVEELGVVVFVSRRKRLLVLSDPAEYVEARGGWTHGGRLWVRLAEEIERLTLIHGPPPVPLEDSGFLLPPMRARKRVPSYALDFKARAARGRRV